MKRKIVGLLALLAAFPLAIAAPALGQEDSATPAAPASPADSGEPGEPATPAQPADPATPPAKDPPKKDDLFDEEGDQGPAVPPSRFLPESDELISEMRGLLGKALKALAAAREDKDAVRLNCVNDKVTAMKGILRISEDSYISLQEAMAAGAMDKAKYEFGKIRISHRKMNALATASQACAGAEASYTGGTDVELQIDDEIVGGDPYYGDPDFFDVPENNVVEGEDGTVQQDDPPDAQPTISSPVE